MLDPLIGLALAGPVLQLIRLQHVVSTLTTTIRAADDLTKVHELRVNVFDTKTTIVSIWRIASGSVGGEFLTDELQRVKSLCDRCEILALTATEELKLVSDSLTQQQSNPFTKESVARRYGGKISINFATVEDYIRISASLAELVASIVTPSLANSSLASFRTLSLKDDVLLSGINTILRLLEFGGANIKPDDFALDGPIQLCMDISTQSRLDQLNEIHLEPLSQPLQRTRLRRKTILDDLYFRQMSDRIEEVNVAYEKTLEWIFRDKQYNLAWSSFPEFLQSSSSDLPYWINGKAGSGKSTLLRFLVRHAKTYEYLRIWSGSKDLEIGHFFSWNLGTILQKTQRGLLQSLVYQILKRDQRLIHLVFPDLWHNIDPSQPTRLSPISFKDMKAAFIKAIEASATQRCYCFFVDGIDEFDEDHVHVADLLLSLTAPTLKFVLSSRPVDACLERFDHCPKLRLQDLTADDIQTYIDGRLSSHATMLEVMQDEPKAAAELVCELKNRASGVFLWVKLVVNSLLDGLRKGDDVTELNVRLQELPPDLSKLYASMLGKMDPNYSRQAATLFRLVRTASVLLDGKCMPTQFLAVAGRDFRSVMNGRPVGFETTKIVLWCKSLMRQLYSRCCGLVEVSSSIYTPDWWHADLDNLAHVDQKLLSSHIQFLHRTVTEYLYQDHVWDTMVSKSSGTSVFNPHENLAYAALHMMKISPLADKLSDTQAYQWAQILVRAARAYEREEEEPLEDLIDEMDLVLRHHVSNEFSWMSHTEIEPAQKIAVSHLSVLQSSIQSLLSFTAFVGLSRYMEVKLEKHDIVVGTDVTMQQTLLQTLFSRSSDWTNIELTDKFNVISCLLEYGASPNETFRGPSFWQCCLQQIGALNCQTLSFRETTGHRRRSSRRTRFESDNSHDGRQCKCDLEDVRIWAQLLVCCLDAGARHTDINYLASFAQSGQGSQVCCFAQMCQILYQMKTEGSKNIKTESDHFDVQNLINQVSHSQRRGANYGTNMVSGSASAHLGDEYTYGNKITYIHHNYFGGPGDTQALLPQVSSTLPDFNPRKFNGVCSNDLNEILAWFRNAVSEALKTSPSATSRPNATDLDTSDTELTVEERTLILESHWRGEVAMWSDRRCGNEQCGTNTTGGWDYVPTLQKLLCLDCYQAWRHRSLEDKNTRNRDLVFTMEEIFVDSFNTISLITTTNDSDDSDDDDEYLPDEYSRGDGMRVGRTLPSANSEPDDIFVTPRSASISINRPATSTYDNSYSLTSGSAHHLRSYRSRG